MMSGSSKKNNPLPGDLVELWDDGLLVSAVILAEEKGRLRAVTESGNQIRITASRIVHRTSGKGAIDATTAHAAATRHAEEGKRLAEGIDLVALWELLLEDERSRYSLAELAELAVQGDPSVACSALIRRLSAEKAYFDRKGESWMPRSREAVEQTRKREAAEADKARRREDFLGRGRQAASADGEPPALQPGDSPFVNKLIDFAVHGDESVTRKEASVLLADLGLSSGLNGKGAFDLLVRLGRFTEDQNLELLRFNLRTEFPEDVLRAALQAAQEASQGASAPAGGSSPRDLTHLNAFTIDDATTTEIDDALSWEPQADGSGVLGIHIADPSHFVAPGSIVDEEAFRRASTYYFPDGSVRMIPPSISEEAGSLKENEERPAISFLITVDPDGKAQGFELGPSRIRSRRRLTYAAVDAALEGGIPGDFPDIDGEILDALKALRSFAVRFEEERAGAGAVLIRAPEVNIKVDRDGNVTLEKADERGPARRLVAEFMILANTLAAEYCVRARIPCIYRRQPPPEHVVETPPDGPYDPVMTRLVRRSMRKGEVSLTPDSHYALGVSVYMQFTSPLRRYQDLAMHRQVKAHIAGEPLPYEDQQLAAIAATTEEAERAARKAEAGGTSYWILKYMASRQGEEVEGIIVAVEHRRSVVELTDTLKVISIAPRPDHQPGQRLKLVIVSADPRAGTLHIRQL